MEEVQTMLPENTPVILVSSSNILASSPSPSSPLWRTLPSHLVRLVPPYEPPPPSQPVGSSGSTIKGHVKSKPSEAKSLNSDIVLTNHTSGGHSTVGFLTGISSAKKWAGYLTFNGRSKPATPLSVQEAFTPPRTSRTPSITKEGPEEGTTQKPVPTPSHPDVDQQSLQEAISSTQTAEPPTTSQAKQQSTETPSSPPKAHTSILSPALEYLTTAGGFFGVAKPTSDKETATTEGTRVNSESTQAPELPKPVVDIIDISSDNDDGEDAKTEISQKSTEDQTTAEQSLQNILSHAGSIEQTSDVPLVAEQPISEDVTHDSATVEIESAPSQISSTRRSSISISEPVIPLPPPEAFFVPFGAYLEDEETKELHLRRIYHMSVRKLGNVVD